MNTIPGERTICETITLSADNWGTGQVVTFWNVTDPQKVEVSMNGGKATYTESDGIANLQEVENVPAYGATTKFDPQNRVDSPDMDNDNKDGAGIETGAVAEDENKTYQIYTATVEMAIPVARLEVSGIKHITGSHVTGTDPGNGKLGAQTASPADCPGTAPVYWLYWEPNQ